MNSVLANGKHPLSRGRFPLASKYDPQWVFDNEMGPNVLWLTEYLLAKLSINAGNRVMDLGCGTALSSIFLAREFGVQVWATDLWINQNDNWKRILQAEVSDQVFPIHSDVHCLPFAHEFFDVITAIDSYHYFGTDELFLGSHLIRYLKPGGRLGIIVPGLRAEFSQGVPDHFKEVWEPELFSFHSAAWWRNHLEKTGLVVVESCDHMEDGHDMWRDWEAFLSDFAPRKPSRSGDLDLLMADKDKDLTFVRLVARKV